MLAPLRVSAARISVLACLAALAGLAAMAYGMARPESVIERSYADAFDRLEKGRGIAVAGNAAAFDPAHLHLSRLPVPVHATVPVGPSLAVGDRITLAQRAGGTAAYEVVEVRPLPGAALGEAGAGTRAGMPGLLMVTAVTNGEQPAQTIRFLIDAADALAAIAPRPAVPAAKPHAL